MKKKLIAAVLFFSIILASGCSSSGNFQNLQNSSDNSIAETSLTSETETAANQKLAFSTWEEYIKNEMKVYIKSNDKVTVGESEGKKVISVNVDEMDIDNLKDFLFACSMLALSVGNYGDGSDSLPSDIGHVIIYFPQGTLGIMYIKDDAAMYRRFPLGVSTNLSIKDTENKTMIQKYYDDFFSLSDIMKGI